MVTLCRPFLSEVKGHNPCECCVEKHPLLGLYGGSQHPHPVTSRRRKVVHPAARMGEQSALAGSRP